MVSTNKSTHILKESKNMRLDKWLWAARFFKTRSNASAAVAGGKVRLNGNRTKPAKSITPGDQLRIRRGNFEFMLTVDKLCNQRRQASEAQNLYTESETSLAQRADMAAQQRAARAQGVRKSGRPDKKGRRQIIRAKKGV